MPQSKDPRQYSATSAMVGLLPSEKNTIIERILVLLLNQPTSLTSRVE